MCPFTSVNPIFEMTVDNSMILNSLPSYPYVLKIIAYFLYFVL